jgi:hypothetical protein
MMEIVLRFCLLLLVVGGCYTPSPSPGARCAEGGRCPMGLTCRDDICVDPTTPIADAAIDARTIDATPPDALDLSGCADGAREAFTDIMKFPTIAGCAAQWSSAANLRAARTNQLCGDDLQLCAAPVDACAQGWHVCGTNGLPSDLTSRANEAECARAGSSPIANARFVTAVAHCSGFDGAGVCTYNTPLGCPAALSCGEPICCGAGCRTDAGCAAGAYATTLVAGTLDNGCGSMLASAVTGVLCCRD